MVDEIEIIVRGGNGGPGEVSFRREKFIPRGGPNGGDGGDGGSVWLQADSHQGSLRPFASRRAFVAQKGSRGRGSHQQGKRGEDLILPVPCGTLVYRLAADGKYVLADLVRAGEKVLVARGGQGGWGNTLFASATNRAPTRTRAPEAGQEARLFLELRIPLDVAMVGLPGAGKSALLARLTRARPSHRPFASREPVLGVVEADFRQYVFAELPDLVPGAHEGKGLGNSFLRHALRAQVLIMLLDGSLPHPREDARGLKEKLALSQPELALKPLVLAVNKIDLPGVRERQDILREALGPGAYFLSAATGEGVPELLKGVLRSLAPAAAQSRGL